MNKNYLGTKLFEAILLDICAGFYLSPHIQNSELLKHSFYVFFLFNLLNQSIHFSSLSHHWKVARIQFLQLEHRNVSRIKVNLDMTLWTSKFLIVNKFFRSGEHVVYFVTPISHMVHSKCYTTKKFVDCWVFVQLKLFNGS